MHADLSDALPGPGLQDAGLQDELDTGRLDPRVRTALQEGRLSAGFYSQLLSTDGVPVNAVSEPCVVIVPDVQTRPTKLTLHTTGTASPKGEARPTFESAEHVFLGDTVTLHWPDQQGPAKDHPLHLENGLVLTYGQVVALSGDFYGIPNKPISDAPDPLEGFLQAYNTLAGPAGSIKTEVKAILETMQYEIDAVNRAIKAGQEPSSAYDLLGDSLSYRWDSETGGKWYKNIPVRFGRYLKLAAKNWDHFGKHAVVCYRAGHELAMKAAVEARNAPPTRQKLLLERAYAINAFADHFLSDIFSAGHMRTPRRELNDLTLSLCARYMHDEDSHYGLTVRNAAGQTWKAYGDKKLRDSDNRDSLKIVQTAMQASADDVWRAFTTGDTSAYSALRYIPDLDRVADPQNRENHAALFIPGGLPGAYRRRKIDDRQNYEWVERWLPFATLGRFRGLPEYQHLECDSLPFPLYNNILQLAGGKQLSMVQYGVKQDGTFGEVWRDNTAGDGSTQFRFMAVDIHGDGKTRILQLRKNLKKNHLAMTIYEPNANGIGYSRGWKNDDMGIGLANIQWLAVDMHGTGKTDIVQIWKTQEKKVGMAVYSPEGEGYHLASVAPRMSTFADFKKWLGVRMDGDGRTSLVQIHEDSKKNLAMTVYTPNDKNGYDPGPSKSFPGIGADAMLWLAADVNGDGVTELVRFWNKDGVLQSMVFEKVPYKSEYQLIETSNLTVKHGAVAVNWMAVDINGIEKPDIVQFWDNDGALAMNLYSFEPGVGMVLKWRTSGIPGLPDPRSVWLQLGAGVRHRSTIAQLRPEKDHMVLTIYTPDESGTGYTTFAKPFTLGSFDNLAFFAVDTTGYAP